MNNPNDFESKIREKLDQNRVDFQESYWNTFDQTYPLPWYQKIRFSWKSHAIFAYSLLSFALGYLWNSDIFKKSSASANPTVSSTDTLFIVKETIYKDTVFMYQQNSGMIREVNANGTEGIAKGTVFVSNSTSNGKFSKFNEPLSQSSSSSNAIEKASPSDLTEANHVSIVQVDHTIKPPRTSNGNELSNKNDNNPSLALAETSQVGSNRSLVSPESKENNLLDSSDMIVLAEVAITKPENKTGSKDTNILENFRVFTANDGDSEGVDSSNWEDPEIAKMNLKKGSWEWGLGLNTLAFMPFEQGEVNYNVGLFGGIEVHAKRNRWSVHSGLLYGANFVEIEEVDQVDIAVSHEFAGFKNLSATPEDVRMVTQTLAPHVDFEYALLSKAKYGTGISASILGILPMERLFIYDYSWQSQVRTRESQPGMDPFKLLPNAGLSLWYQPRYDWQIQLGAKFYPTMINGKMHEANSVAPFAIQLGVLKYW